MEKHTAGKVSDLLLVGQPNCGKSTLFNRLCGARRRTGNYAGVTVDSAAGHFSHRGRRYRLTDLPGLYAMTDGGAEETVTAERLKRHTGGILFVADASALEAALPFALDVLALGLPTVIALNMADETARRGVRIDYGQLSALVGVPVLPISARFGTGVDELLDALDAIDVSRARGIVRQSAKEILAAVLHRETRFTASDRADRILLRPYVGIPAAVILLSAIVFTVFGPIGGRLHDGVEILSDRFLFEPVKAFFAAHTVHPFTASLLTDGIFSGVVGVLSFLPQIALLFLLLAVLEDVGVTARIAFLFDPILGRFGLSGMSILPLSVGLGCTVPAILSARVEEKTARKRLYYVLSFVSCPARAPVYALLASVFFPRLGWVLTLGLYLLGLFVLLLSAKLLSIKKADGERIFILELPPYRLPYPPAVLRYALDKCRAFVRKAGTVILAASAGIWALERFGVHGIAAGIEDSFLGSAGRVLAPLLAPLGFGNPVCSAALVSGFFAKESMVSAITVLSGGAQNASALFAPASAVSFLVFTLLYTPCAASVAAIRKEAGGRTAVRVCLFDFAAAYAVSLLFYRLALLL